MSLTVRNSWPLPETALKPALELVLAIEHAPIGVLLLRSAPTRDLEPVVAEGMTDEQWSRFAPKIRDVVDDGHHGDVSLADIARKIGFQGLEIVPLVADDGTTIGAMAALFRVSRRPSARTARLAEQCGRLIALALDNARLRADAERRREMVEGMARARVQYMAKMGHELRTPLQSITGYIDLMRLGTDSLTARQSQMLDRVRESERILIHAIDDLGTMARLEAGRLEYLIVTTVASNAIAQSVAVIEPLADRKNIHIEVGGRDNLVVLADEMKLKQILVNLLANAVKFTPSGGSICVGTRADGPTVAFEVSDTGPGIPENKLHDVFEPFVQLDNSPVSGLAGSGLGLAISQEFAHGMKGTLTASSEPGHGSTFRLRLPRG